LEVDLRETLLSKKESLFFKWLKKDPEKDEDCEGEEDVLTGKESCAEFDWIVNFEIGKLAWETPHKVYEDHLRYLGNDIIKPLAMTVKELELCFDKMYSLKKYLPPPHKRDEDAFDANWSKKNEPIEFDEQRRSHFNALPTSYKESLKDKDEDWKSMTSTKWMQVLTRLKIKSKTERDKKRVFQLHNNNVKKAKLEQLAKETSKSLPKESTPRTNSSKYNHRRN